MTFLVLSSDEPLSGPRLSATCVPLDYDRQQELASTSAYCYRVGVPFQADDMHLPLHNAEVVCEGGG